MCLLGNIEDCTDGTLGDPDAPRCSRKSSLAMALFLFYALITTIMLINLLIAIFRLYFLRQSNKILTFKVTEHCRGMILLTVKPTFKIVMT